MTNSTRSLRSTAAGVAAVRAMVRVIPEFVSVPPLIPSMVVSVLYNPELISKSRILDSDTDPAMFGSALPLVLVHAVKVCK